MRNIRLVDVARAAGVSRSTASNVFNTPEAVRPALRDRVEAAARDLGYVGPDPKARAMRAGKFNAIGVVSPAQWGVADALANPVYRKFLRGVGEACDKVGASMVVIPDQRDGRGIRGALVDGFIFGRFEHLDLLSLARQRRLPYAVVDVDPGRDVNSVRVDSRTGAREAARHLLALGHRRFGIISALRGAGPALLHEAAVSRPSGIAGMPTDQEKLLGYAEAFAEAGLDISDVPVVQARPEDTAAPALLLDAAPRMTAILSMTVMQAIAALQEARRRGLAVPRDLSIVGFNDIPEAEHCDPPITTVDSHGTEKGRIAAEMVLEHQSGRQVVLTPRLIVRGSTAAARDR